ncbi:MAG TPA: carboxypeptidase regulatory-like domain-containing protein [Cyclobacteriaceae bacterium]
MKIMGTLLVLLAGLLLPEQSGLCQRQGIKGQVFWLSGNQMPGPDRTVAPDLGISREILIYELTTFSDAAQQDMFFSDIKTRQVASVVSRDDGRFKVKLPPGRYSVFVKEPKGLFANLFTGSGEINPVTVEPKKYAWMSITVDYEAAY